MCPEVSYCKYYLRVEWLTLEPWLYHLLTSHLTPSDSVSLSEKWGNKSTYLTNFYGLNKIVQAKDLAKFLIPKCLNTPELFYFWSSPSLLLLLTVLYTQLPLTSLPANQMETFSAWLTTAEMNCLCLQNWVKFRRSELGTYSLDYIILLSSRVP